MLSPTITIFRAETGRRSGLPLCPRPRGRFSLHTFWEKFARPSGENFKEGSGERSPGAPGLPSDLQSPEGRAARLSWPACEHLSSHTRDGLWPIDFLDENRDRGGRGGETPGQGSSGPLAPSEVPDIGAPRRASRTRRPIPPCWREFAVLPGGFFKGGEGAAPPGPSGHRGRLPGTRGRPPASFQPEKSARFRALWAVFRPLVRGGPPPGVRDPVAERGSPSRIQRGRPRPPATHRSGAMAV